MTHVRYLVPHAGDYGGIQRFAHDCATNLPPEFTATVVDLGARRATQLARIGRLGISATAQRVGSKSTRATDLTHHWHLLSGAAPMIAPGIVTCHGNELLERRFERAHRHALRRARAITTNSGFTRELVLSRFDVDEAKVVVVHPGVSMTGLEPGDPPTGARIAIGTLCRFVERKNIVRTIDALKLLRERDGLDIVYQLAGSGPLEREIRTHLDASGLPYRYWGAISDQVKNNEFLPSLSAFVLPALALPNDVEGFGIVYLEANALGVPVVAAPAGGAGEAVADGQSGMLAEPTDIDSIADAVRRVLALGAPLRVSARSWAQRFSTEETGRRLAALYQRCGPGAP